MIFLFDKFKKLKGTVRNRHTISLLYERERNGLYTVSAEIPLKITDKKTVYNYHKKVKDSDFLGHYDREGRFQLHKIASVDIEDSSIFIKGVHLFFDEAKAGAIIKERRFRQAEIIDGARVAFDSIGWSVVDFDVSDTKDYIFYNVSPLEARAILVETFGFEFDYWLDFDGKNIRNKQISVKREMGKDSNKRYNYGHNVLNIKVEQDYSEIYTAVIGRGKGEDLGDDAYGRRIEYTDVVWKTPTNPMNKPKGSRTLHDENATQLFGYHEDGKVSPRTKVEIFEDIEDPAELLQASYEWLKENSVPKAVFSLKVPDGDGLDLGDKVHVIYRDIDLVKHTRVTRVIDDLVSGNRDVEFGDTAYFKTDRRLSGVKSELKRVGGSMSSRISRLKAEFDRRFDNEVQQWKDDFEQALIDAEAAVEVMRAEMTEELATVRREMTNRFETEKAAAQEEAQRNYDAISKRITNVVDTTRAEMNTAFEESVREAKKFAATEADAKAGQVQNNLDSFAGRHELLVGELQENIVDIDGGLEAARAEVSGIIGSLSDLTGRVSGTEATLTVMDNEISSVVGRVSENETDISSVVQDVSSITSTVTSLEGDVATQGSQITQAKDVIESKVWLDDVANINPNLIPFTDVSAKESKPHWNNWGSGATNTWVDNLGYMNVDTTDTNGTVRIQSEELELEEGQEYTLSFLARTSGEWNTDGLFGYTFILWPGQSSNQILSSGNHIIEYLGDRLSGLRRYTHTFVAKHTGTAKIMLGTYKFRKDEYSRFSFKEPKLEKGSERTPFLNAFSNIEQTANTIKLSVLGELEGGYVTKSEFDVTIEGIESRVSEIDGGGVLKQSDISVTSDSVIIGSQEISNTKLASIIAVSPRAVDIITSKLNLTGNLNVKGQIESISMSAVKADFADLFAARVKAGAVHADYVEGFSARFNRLYTLNANIERLTAQFVFTDAVHAKSLDAIEANIGRVRTAFLKADVISGSHIKSNTIEIKHLTGYDAILEMLMARKVFSSEVTTLSLNAVEANIGSVRSQILTSNVIKSSHIAGGTALIDKIFSSTAMFERMMSKSAFVNTLNTVSIHANTFSSTYPGSKREITMQNGRATFKYGSVVIENASGRRTIIDGKINRSQTMTPRMPKFQSSEVNEDGSWYRTLSTSYVTAHEEYFVHEARHIRVAMAVHRWGMSGWCDGRMETRSGKISNYLTTNNDSGAVYGWLKIDMGEPLDRPVSDSLIYTFKSRNGGQSKRMHLGNRFLTDFPENI